MKVTMERRAEAGGCNFVPNVPQHDAERIRGIQRSRQVLLLPKYFNSKFLSVNQHLESCFLYMGFEVLRYLFSSEPLVI